jgi:hypothetical protein
MPAQRPHFGMSACVALQEPNHTGGTNNPFQAGDVSRCFHCSVRSESLIAITPVSPSHDRVVISRVVRAYSDKPFMTICTMPAGAACWLPIMLIQIKKRRRRCY